VSQAVSPKRGLEFAAAGGPVAVIRSPRRAIRPDQLAVIGSPDVYARVLRELLFGLLRENLPETDPIDPARPVSMTLRWVGTGDSPIVPDDGRMDIDDWRLVDITQDHDGVQIGYLTETDPAVLSAAVLDFLSADGWEAMRTDSEGPFRTTYAGDSGIMDVELFVDEERQFLVVVAHLPLVVPINRIPEVGELALRLSSMMDVASTDIDYDTGSVRVRSSVDLEAVPISRNIIRNTVYAAVVQGDSFVPAYIAVAEGMSPVDALEQLHSTSE
jgi:hypothetical protein